jgi:predicted AAA+ superfamily ATPase
MATCVRKLFVSLYNHLQAKEYTIIIGARQTGKSMLLLQLYQKLKEEGKQAYQLTFEDPRVLGAIDEHPENIFNFVPQPQNERLYLLIDEVQYAQNPTNFLKLLYDKYLDKIKIIATGSSAFYIDRKFKDSLAGRKQIFELYTLDFEEFIDFRSDNKLQFLQELQAIKTKPDYQSLYRDEITQLFDEYLVYGGYPAVVLASSKEEKLLKLRELVNTYIKRDIYESDVVNELKFYNLITLLANQAGSLVNVSELANTLKLSVTAVDNYLYILQKTFHVTLIRPLYSNLRKEITKMPKVYFNDTGLRNMLLNYFEPLKTRVDKGQLVENYIYIRLRQLYGTDALKYWRTADGNEVDFVVSTKFNEGFAIEAKYNADEFKPGKYKKFEEHYPQYPIESRAYITLANTGNILAM